MLHGGTRRITRHRRGGVAAWQIRGTAPQKRSICDGTAKRLMSKAIETHLQKSKYNSGGISRCIIVTAAVA